MNVHIIDLSEIQKVQVHFKIKGPLSSPPWIGVTLLPPEDEAAAAARENRLKEHPGDKLLEWGQPRQTNENQKGLIAGKDCRVFESFKLVKATAQERMAKEFTIELVDEKTGMKVHRVKEAHPYQWLSFTWVRSVFPSTQAIGADTRHYFEKLFCAGWTRLVVWRNPLTDKGIPTGESALCIDFAGPGDFPNDREFGVEIAPGVHRVLKAYEKKSKKVPDAVTLPASQ